MELSWFRRPGAGESGTLNLCYNAVDLHVVQGAASAQAVRDGGTTVSFEVLLERIGSLAGAMRALGVGPESVVGVLLDHPIDRLLMLLACLRLGAVHVELSEASVTSEVEQHRPLLVATSRPLEYADHAPAACLVRGIPTEDDSRDLDWDIAVKAGRTDPAPCAALAPGSTAYVMAGVAVPIVAVVEDDSWAGRVCATLCAGQTIDLTDVWSAQAPDFCPGLADPPRGSSRGLSVGPDTLNSLPVIAKPETPAEPSAAAAHQPEDIGGSDASASPTVSRVNQPEPQAAPRPGILGLQSGEDVKGDLA